jgi:hypothetical protein
MIVVIIGRYFYMQGTNTIRMTHGKACFGATC